MSNEGVLVRVEALEFQRRSMVFWRAPYLVNDPLPFKIIKGYDKEHHHSLTLHKLSDFELPKNSIWEGSWSVEFEDNKTDDDGWSYGIRFDSDRFCCDFKYCHFVRKRKHVRFYKKYTTMPTPMTPAKTGGGMSVAITEDIYNSQLHNQEAQVSMMEHVVLEIEKKELLGGQWKPYQSLWFSPLLKPLSIASPEEITLPPPSCHGEWVWIEGWSVLLPSPENISAAQGLVSQAGSKPAWEHLKSIQFFTGNSFIIDSRAMTNLSPSTTSFSAGMSDSEELSVSREDSTWTDISESADLDSLKPEKPKKGFGNRLTNLFKKKEKDPSEDSTNEDSMMSISKSSIGGIGSGGDKPLKKESLIKDGTFDKEGWMYCGSLTKKLYRWRSTNQPSSKKMYRRRIWVRAAIWQPLITNRPTPTEIDKKEAEDGVLMESGEFLITDLLNALLWHVHLMSHESMIKILPTDAAAIIEKEAVGKSHVNQECTDGKIIECRTRAAEEPSKGGYGAKIANITKSVVSSLRAATSKATGTFQRITDISYIDNIRARALRLGDLFSALKKLQFRNDGFEDSSSQDTRLLLKQLLGSSLPNTQEGATDLCDKLFKRLSMVLSESIFHSSTQTYSSSDRNRLMKSLTEICVLYTALKEGGLMTNTSILSLLLHAVTQSVNQADDHPDNKKDVNPLWILDDLFHMKKKFATLNLTHLQKLCLFFPDLLTNMKHVVWMIRHDKKSLNIWNAKLAVATLQGAQRNIEVWLKYMHDSVKPNVVAEVILLYYETCTCNEIIGNKPRQEYADFAAFLSEYMKQSIIFAYSKIKEQYRVAAILKGAKSELVSKFNSYNQTCDKSDGHKMKAVMPQNATKNKKLDEPQVPQAPQPKSSIGGKEIVSLAAITQEVQLDQYRQIQEQISRERAEEKKQKEAEFMEYFRDESKKKTWWQYIEEIELLFQDDSDISITLWQRGIFSGIPEDGMEALALKFVSDIINLLAANQESLDSTFRTLLAGAYRLQVLLQTLCYRYILMEQTKTPQLNRIKSDDDSWLLEKTQTGRVNIETDSMKEIFGESVSLEELQKLDHSASRQRVDQIFNFVQFEVTMRLQDWMEQSLYRTGAAIVRAAEIEVWESHVTRELERRPKQVNRGVTIRVTAPSDDWRFNDNKITWANFATDAFVFLDNEINAYFANIQGFPSEAMATSTQFFQQLYFLVEYILKIISGALADVAIFDNETQENADVNTSIHSSMESGVSKKGRKHASNKILGNFSKAIDEIGKANRKAFGLIISTVDAVQERVVDSTKEFSKFLQEPSVLRPNSSSLVRNIDTIADTMREVCLLEDEQFKKELKHVCVKFSCISRIQEVIVDVGKRILGCIGELEVPKAPHLQEKFEQYRQQLVASAHKFVNDSKTAIDHTLHFAACQMACQLIDVQNQRFFSFELYAQRKISTTTALKLLLINNLHEYLNMCDDCLRYKDLRLLTCCLASVYSKRMSEVLIGKTPRLFTIDDNSMIGQDFEEVYGLFSSFNEIDFDDKRNPLTNPDNPFNVYYEVVELMKQSTIELMHKHVLIMAQRSEEEKKREKELELKEEKEKETASKNRSEKNQTRQEPLPSIVSMANKVTIQRNRLKRIHDHPVLHVLAHRIDEEAQTYVENFVQFRNKNQPLLLDFCDMNGILRIIIHSAKDIPPMDLTGTSDPYVKVTVDTVINCTRIMRRTVTPVWQQPLDFDLDDNALRNIQKAGRFVVTFEVMDWNPVSQNEFIGQHQITIDVNQRKPDIVEKWLPLLNQQNDASTGTKGELMISIELGTMWIALNKFTKIVSPKTDSTTERKKKKKGFFGVSD